MLSYDNSQEVNDVIWLHCGIVRQPHSLDNVYTNLPLWQQLKIAERGFVEGFQIGGVIMLGEYESFVFIDKGGNSAGVLSI